MARDAFGNYYVSLTPASTTTGNSMRGGLHGSGAPSNDLGNDGQIYVDDDTGDLYVKVNNSWMIVQGAPGGSGEAGVGSPEGVVTASPGTTYIDTSTNNLWIKVTGSGNTGWVQLIG